MKLINWIFILAFALTGCKSCSTHQAKHRTSTVQDVKEMKPDCEKERCRLGYAYQDDSMIWWYLWWYSPNYGMGYNYYNSYNSSTYITSNGGGWTRSDTAPQSEEVVGEKSVTVQETEAGQPEAVSANQDSPPEQVIDQPTVEQEQQADQQAVESFENEGGAAQLDDEGSGGASIDSPSYDSPSDSSSGGDGGDGGGGGGGD